MNQNQLPAVSTSKSDSERRKSKLMAEFAEADAKFLAEQEAKRKAVGFIGEIPDTFSDGG